MLSINRTGHILIQLLLRLISQPLIGILNLRIVIMTQIIVLKVKALVDQHLPTVRLTKRQRKTELKSWITTVIVKALSEHDFFFRKFVQEKNPEIKAQFHTLFKTYRNSIITLCRKSKSNYFTNYFNQNFTCIKSGLV